MATPIKIVKTTFMVKRAPKEDWESVNPILKPGEPGCELGSQRLKLGDGTTPWNELPYVGAYNGPTADTDLSEYVKKADMASYLEPYMKKETIASGTILGAVKSSEEMNKIKVLEDGTMEVNSLHISKLVQGNDVLILDASE